MSCTRRFLIQLQAARSYVESAIFPLTPIAHAIYKSQLSCNLRRGLGQIIRLPHLLRDTPSFAQTRILLGDTFKTNFFKYWLPVIVYHVLFKEMERIVGKDLTFYPCVIGLPLLIRLFLRRFRDNAFYSMGLPRALSNGLEGHLTETVTADLADEFTRIFSELFSQQRYSATLHAHFKKELKEIFARLFKRVNEWNDASALMMKELERVLWHTFNRLDDFFQIVHAEPNLAKELARYLPALISHQFALGLGQASKINFDQKAIELRKIFEKTHSTRFSTQLLDEVVASVGRTREKVKLFLPVERLKSCQCGYEKKIHAKLSSSFYFLGNLSITYIPDAIESVYPTFPYLFHTQVLSWGMRTLLYGQNLMDSRLNNSNKCTRHRFAVVADNKAFLIGEGIAYLLHLEGWAFILKNVVCPSLAGPTYFFAKDALANFLLLLHLIPAYIFNEPLTDSQNPLFDVFLFHRKALQKATRSIRSAVETKLNEREARKRRLDMIKSALRSNTFFSLHYFLFGPSEFIPYPEYQDLKKEFYGLLQLQKNNTNLSVLNTLDLKINVWEQKQIVVDKLEKLHSESNPLPDVKQDIQLLTDTKNILNQLVLIEGKKDALTLFYECNAVRQYFMLCGKDIQKTMGYAEFSRAISSWFVRPLRVLPFQSALIAILSTITELLQDEGIDEIFRKTRAQVHEADFTSNTLVLLDRTASWYKNENPLALPPPSLKKEVLRELTPDSKEVNPPVVSTLISVVQEDYIPKPKKEPRRDEDWVDLIGVKKEIVFRKKPRSFFSQWQGFWQSRPPKENDKKSGREVELKRF